MDDKHRRRNLAVDHAQVATRNASNSSTLSILSPETAQNSDSDSRSKTSFHHRQSTDSIVLFFPPKYRHQPLLLTYIMARGGIGMQDSCEENGCHGSRNGSWMTNCLMTIVYTGVHAHNDHDPLERADHGPTVKVGHVCLLTDC